MTDYRSKSLWWNTLPEELATSSRYALHSDIDVGFETQYVILSEIEKINPCNFADGVNPLSADKTNALCDLNNKNQISVFENIDKDRKLSNTKESFSNIYNYPQDYLMQIYILFVFILFFYLFYKLNYK